MRRHVSALIIAVAICGCVRPEPKRAPLAPALPLVAELPAPQHLTASDPCLNRWGKPCVTNYDNGYTGKFLMKWDYFENVTGIVFVVRSNNQLNIPVKLWPVAAVTPNKFFAITNMGIAAFFAVTASNTVLGTESDFAQ